LGWCPHRRDAVLVSKCGTTRGTYRVYNASNGIVPIKLKYHCFEMKVRMCRE